MSSIQIYETQVHPEKVAHIVFSSDHHSQGIRLGRSAFYEGYELVKDDYYPILKIDRRILNMKSTQVEKSKESRKIIF